MKLKIVVVFAAIFALSSSVSFAYPGMQKKQQQEVDHSRVNEVNILEKAFPIDSVPFKDANGKNVSFEQYRGKVVMVNMWATWCPPCIRELPAISRLQQKYSDKGLTILPVSIDADGKDKVEPFLKELGMADFSSFYDKEQNLRAVFPLDTIPATFILNKEGELIAFVRTFVDWDDEKAHQLIEQLINKG